MTIEERANEIYPMLQPYFDDNAETREAYIKGATEQRAIDNTEHTEEMRKLNEEWQENLEIQRHMLIDKACKCYCKASSCDINDMQKCVDACLGCEEFRRFCRIIRKD